MQTATEYILGNNIKKFRKEHSLSQAQLAEALGVSQSAVFYWETGKREPNTKTILDLCDLFYVTPNDLYGRHKEFPEKDFKDSCKWLEKAGFSISTETGSDSLQIFSPEGGYICLMSRADIINCVNSCMAKADTYRDQLITDFIRISVKSYV